MRPRASFVDFSVETEVCAVISTLRPRLRFGNDPRQVYVDLLVGDAIEQMSDQVELGAALVVGRDDVPGRLWLWVASNMRWKAAL